MVFKFLAHAAQTLTGKKAEPSGPAQPPAPTRTARTVFGGGDILNQRYVLEAEIGRGGMGVIYRALDIPNQRRVAVKVINPDTANVLSTFQFSREAQISLQFSHPHIVQVYEVGLAEAQGHAPAPFLVMELLTGRTLEDLHNFTVARVVDLGQQICSALEYAHQQGFIHRDLKPGNILLEKRGFQYQAKLGDFGLARPMDAASRAAESSLAGSVFYLAPEVIAGQPASAASDLYAFGVILYEMLTGRVPFSDFFDDQAILAQHLEEPVAPPSQSRPDLPSDMEAIVLRLLAKKPLERFASAGETAAALGQVGLQASPPTPGDDWQRLGLNCAGMEEEIEQVTRQLEASQLVTLLGAAGPLAQAVGAQLASQFTQGAWLVDLEDVTSPDAVLPAVAGRLGIPANPYRALSVSLVENLHEKNLLLILQTPTRLVPACAQLAAALLAACPEVCILADSPVPFNIPGEQIYRRKD